MGRLEPEKRRMIETLLAEEEAALAREPPEKPPSRSGPVL